MSTIVHLADSTTM